MNNEIKMLGNIVSPKERVKLFKVGDVIGWGEMPPSHSEKSPRDFRGTIKSIEGGIATVDAAQFAPNATGGDRQVNQFAEMKVNLETKLPHWAKLPKAKS